MIFSLLQFSVVLSHSEVEKEAIPFSGLSVSPISRVRRLSQKGNPGDICEGHENCMDDLYCFVTNSRTSFVPNSTKTCTWVNCISVDCGDFGTCNSDGTCTCRDDYIGDLCQYPPTCIDKMTGPTCAQYIETGEKCTSTAMRQNCAKTCEVCTCKKDGDCGFHQLGVLGFVCDMETKSCKNACVGVDCGPRGTCDMIAVFGKCNCDDEYTGDKCENPPKCEDFLEPDQCKSDEIQNAEHKQYCKTDIISWGCAKTCGFCAECSAFETREFEDGEEYDVKTSANKATEENYRTKCSKKRETVSVSTTSPVSVSTKSPVSVSTKSPVSVSTKSHVSVSTASPVNGELPQQKQEETVEPEETGELEETVEPEETEELEETTCNFWCKLWKYEQAQIEDFKKRLLRQEQKEEQKL